MRALLDTNIIIHRENKRVSNYSIGHLFRWLDKLKYDKVIHPYSISEIKKYRDPETQEAISVKLESYEVIKTIKEPDDSFLELIGIPDKEFIIRKEVEKIKDKYDFILIDCPPSLNLLTINAMTTADTVLVPIQCEYYALEGLSQLIHTINLVKERLNPYLDMEGIVFTMYDARTNLSLQVVENVRANVKQRVYSTIIPRNVRLAEAPSHGYPITIYDPKSAGAESYRALAEEVINREEE